MNSSLRTSITLALGLALTTGAQAAIVVFDWNNVNLEVPDAPTSGSPLTVSDSHTIATPFTAFSDLTVRLDFAGSDGDGGIGTMWNGDLHVTLAHESGASVVLLNRIGRDVGAPSGASGNGLSITLDASALLDVHSVGSGSPQTGVFQPDGRSANPTLVTSSSPRDALFSNLISAMGGGSPDGRWTLSITDFDSGSLARLKGWSLSVVGVPEPVDLAAAVGLGMLLWAAWRRTRPE